MVFMMAVLVILMLVMVLIIKLFFRKSKTSPLIFIGLILSGMLIDTPILIEMAQVNRVTNGEAISIGHNYLPLLMIGTGGILTMVIFAYRFYQQRLKKEPGFFSVGANAVGLGISMYLIFVAVDQFLFYVPHRQEAGALNWDYFKDKITDIKCDSELLIVNNTDQKQITYRCPARLQLILGRFSGAPFVAWPSYTEGHSEQLAIALQKIRAEAK